MKKLFKKILIIFILFSQITITFPPPLLHIRHLLPQPLYLVFLKMEVINCELPLTFTTKLKNFP